MDRMIGTLEQELLDRRAAMLGFIRGRVGDDEPAEDILQDSLLRVLQSGPERLAITPSNLKFGIIVLPVSFGSGSRRRAAHALVTAALIARAVRRRRKSEKCNHLIRLRLFVYHARRRQGNTDSDRISRQLKDLVFGGDATR